MQSTDINAARVQKNSQQATLQAKGLGIEIHRIKTILVSYHKHSTERKIQGEILLITQLVPKEGTIQHIEFIL